MSELPGDSDFRECVDTSINNACVAIGRAYAAVRGKSLTRDVLNAWKSEFDATYRHAAPGSYLIRTLSLMAVPPREIRALCLHLAKGSVMELIASDAIMKSDGDQELGYVYLLSSGKYFKIGASNDIPARIRQLQTGSPLSIKLLDFMVCDATRINEQEIHKHFLPQRMKGEWFSLSKRHVADVRTWFRNGIPTIVADPLVQS